MEDVMIAENRRSEQTVITAYRAALWYGDESADELRLCILIHYTILRSGNGTLHTVVNQGMTRV